MELRIIAGPNCSPSLIVDLQRKFGELVACQVNEFLDHEVLVQIDKNVRGCDVNIIQPTNAPDQNFQVLLQLIQAAALGSATSITAVMPYMGCLRQDRKDKPRRPITAKLHARMIEQAMVAASQRHAMILQPHFPQIQGFFDIATDLLYPTSLFLEELGKIVNGDFSRVVPVAADSGGVNIVKVYARRLNTDSFAVGDKRRTGDSKVEYRSIIGDVRGKIAVVFEDIIDTAGTIKKLVLKLTQEGAEEVYVFAAHGVLAEGAIQNLRDAGEKLKRVFITDSIRHPNDTLPEDLITVVRCGELLANAIKCNHEGGSISEIAGCFN